MNSVIRSVNLVTNHRPRCLSIRDSGSKVSERETSTSAPVRSGRALAEPSPRPTLSRGSGSDFGRSFAGRTAGSAFRRVLVSPGSRAGERMAAPVTLRKRSGVAVGRDARDRSSRTARTGELSASNAGACSEGDGRVGWRRPAGSIRRRGADCLVVDRKRSLELPGQCQSDRCNAGTCSSEAGIISTSHADRAAGASVLCIDSDRSWRRAVAERYPMKRARWLKSCSFTA